jgi:hypothetical protein
MSSADCHTLLVEQYAEILRMDTVNNKRYNPCALSMLSTEKTRSWMSHDGCFNTARARKLMC